MSLSPAGGHADVVSMGRGHKNKSSYKGPVINDKISNDNGWVRLEKRLRSIFWSYEDIDLECA